MLQDDIRRKTQCRSQQLVKIMKWQDVAMDCYMLVSLAGIPLCIWFSNEALSFQTFRQYSLCSFEALEFHQTCMYSKINGFDNWYQKVHKTCPCSKSKKQQYYLLSLWSFCRQHHSIMQFWYQNHWFSRVYAASGKIACSKSYFFGFSCRLVSGVEVVKPAESMHFWGEKSSQSKWIPSLNILSFHLRIESIHLQNWNMRTRIKHWYLQC